MSKKGVNLDKMRTEMAAMKAARAAKGGEAAGADAVGDGAAGGGGHGAGEIDTKLSLVHPLFHTKFAWY
jgi:hypothetical protein